MKLILMGSCVSRDIFGPKFENGWNGLHIDMSFNRSSLISLNGEPFNIDVTANPYLNPFQRRSLSDDLNKTFCKYISRLKYDGHYLLFDFVDERFGLFLYEGKYASISNEFLASKLMDELPGKIIPRFSEETTRLWKENCLLFIEKVLDVFDPEHIILHRAFWMERYIDGDDISEFLNQDEIHKQNDLLQTYCQYFEEQCPGIHVLDMNDLGFLADKNHFRGLGPMHYQKEYYDRCIQYFLSFRVPAKVNQGKS